jgi:predicted permease
MEFVTILAATIPVFLIVGTGFFLRRIGVVTDDAERSIMKIVINLLYPCFILSNVPGNPNLENVSLVGLALVVGFALPALALLVSFVVGRLTGIDSRPELRTFCVATAIQNYGFIPIPLIIALFPATSKATLGVLFIHNLGLEIAMWTIGIVVLSGSMKGAGRRLINGPTIAIALGLLLNFSGLHEWIPEVVGKAITDLGNCSIPISLLLVGASLASVLQAEAWVTQWPVIGGSLAVRFAIMPLLFLGAAQLVSYSPELRNVLIVQSAMPAAIFPVVLAKYFGGRPSVAVQVCLTTSVASLLMTPLLLTLALRWFEIPLAD